MPKIPKPKPKRKSVQCVACNDTGKNSRGGPCIPCEIRKRPNPTLNSA